MGAEDRRLKLEREMYLSLFGFRQVEGGVESLIFF